MIHISWKRVIFLACRRRKKIWGSNSGRGRPFQLISISKICVIFLARRRQKKFWGPNSGCDRPRAVYGAPFLRSVFALHFWRSVFDDQTVLGAPFFAFLFWRAVFGAPYLTSSIWRVVFGALFLVRRFWRVVFGAPFLARRLIERAVLSALFLARRFLARRFHTTWSQKKKKKQTAVFCSFETAVNCSICSKLQFGDVECLARRFWRAVFDAPFLVRRFWRVIFGASLIFGASFLARRFWRAVFGASFLARCFWHVVFGALFLARRFWRAVFGALFYARRFWRAVSPLPIFWCEVRSEKWKEKWQYAKGKTDSQQANTWSWADCQVSSRCLLGDWLPPYQGTSSTFEFFFLIEILASYILQMVSLFSQIIF